MTKNIWISFSIYNIKTRPRPQKLKILRKTKKHPKIYKEQVCKTSAKSDHLWSLQAAPKYLGDIHRQTFYDSSSTEVKNNTSDKVSCVALMIYPRILRAGQNEQNIDFPKSATIRIKANAKY